MSGPPGSPADPAPHPPPRTIVFVEGASDHAALVALAERLERDLAAEGTEIVSMNGFSGIGRLLATYGPSGRGLLVAGLCDAAEAGYVRSRLTAAGVDRHALAVCDADLEDELIRAHGARGVEAVLEALGESTAFRGFQQQPAQRGRPLEAQLRRFLGTRSGRKVAAARALVTALPLEAVPRPLLRVFKHDR